MFANYICRRTYLCWTKNPQKSWAFLYFSTSYCSQDGSFLLWWCPLRCARIDAAGGCVMWWQVLERNVTRWKKSTFELFYHESRVLRLLKYNFSYKHSMLCVNRIQFQFHCYLFLIDWVGAPLNTFQTLAYDWQHILFCLSWLTHECLKYVLTYWTKRRADGYLDHLHPLFIHILQRLKHWRHHAVVELTLK